MPSGDGVMPSKRRHKWIFTSRMPTKNHSGDGLKLPNQWHQSTKMMLDRHMGSRRPIPGGDDLNSPRVQEGPRITRGGEPRPWFQAAHGTEKPHDESEQQWPQAAKTMTSIRHDQGFNPAMPWPQAALMIKKAHEVPRRR